MRSGNWSEWACCLRLWFYDAVDGGGKYASANHCACYWVMFTYFLADSVLCQHRASSLMNYDTVIVLDNGVVVEQDSPQNLLTYDQGVFASLMNKTKLLSVWHAATEDVPCVKLGFICSTVFCLHVSLRVSGNIAHFQTNPPGLYFNGYREQHQTLPACALLLCSHCCIVFVFVKADQLE